MKTMRAKTLIYSIRFEKNFGPEIKLILSFSDFEFWSDGKENVNFKEIQKPDCIEWITDIICHNLNTPKGVSIHYQYQHSTTSGVTILFCQSERIIITSNLYKDGRHQQTAKLLDGIEGYTYADHSLDFFIN